MEREGRGGKGMEGKNVLPHVKQAVAAYEQVQLIVKTEHNIYLATETTATFQPTYTEGLMFLGAWKHQHHL